MVGMCAYGGIFQSKLEELLGGIGGVKTYIYDKLVIIKDKFPKNIDQLIFIFPRQSSTGLKFNTPK